jgi:hypothetical protein
MARDRSLELRRARVAALAGDLEEARKLFAQARVCPR